MTAESATPAIGECVEFKGVECEILVEAVPVRQPLKDEGILIIADQYGEKHLCEQDYERWAIVRPDMLTPDQAELLGNWR